MHPCRVSRWFLVAVLSAWLGASAHSQTRRVDPAGIPGTLLLCGGGDVTQAALERFIELAGGADAKIVFLRHHSSDDEKRRNWPVMERLHALAKKPDAGAPVVAYLENPGDALRNATGVWLLVEPLSTKAWQTALQKSGVPAEIRAMLKRGGVLATAGAGTDLMPVDGGLDLLPGLLERGDPDYQESKLAERVKAIPGQIGFRIDTGASMQLKGRTISAVGDRKITIHVAGNPSQRVIAVEGKTRADLTALRRSAYDRAKSFPPAQVGLPFVEKGTLVIVGGGGSPAGLYRKFVEYAGGEGKANIVVFPTANADPIPNRGFIAAAFKKAGAMKATVLYGKTQAEVESKQFLDTLKEATGLWFDGGRQWLYVDCYESTKALPLMFDVLKRGGVIGGTSAGATIQGDYLCRGGVFNNLDVRYEGYERGLGFLKGVAIDQHFSQRKRQGQMTSLMKLYPQYLGIGLDEATAIVVKGSVADVIGTGKAFFYDARRKTAKGAPDYQALSAGGRYELAERRVLATQK